MITLDELKKRYSGIRSIISDAAIKSGRNPEDVRLVAITKTWPREVVQMAAEAGIMDIGENRVQEALTKLSHAPEGVRYHLVGHLQRNKVRKALQLFDIIHSVDSISLGRAIGTIAAETERTVDALVQVNIGEDDAKHGVRAEDAFHIIQELQSENGIRVIGLMTIGPFFDDPQDSRLIFRKLLELRDQIAPQFPMVRELSMGMTADYNVAVEEGATIVRVGTALFGPRYK